MKDNKFCFIICTNQDRFYRECEFYVSHLRIPEGYEAEIMPVHDALSMASGYNSAMSATDAKYKIYLHQDVFILNPNFLADLLKIFASDENIAMVGMQGAEKTAPNAVHWDAPMVGALYHGECGREDYAAYQYDIAEGIRDCEYVDGMLMVTNRDLPWREELFDGWCFYDMAQCFEFRKQGWRVVVPEQRIPWCAHEEGVRTLWNYDRYRKIFIREYMG